MPKKAPAKKAKAASNKTKNEETKPKRRKKIPEEGGEDVQPSSATSGGSGR